MKKKTLIGIVVGLIVTAAAIGAIMGYERADELKHPLAQDDPDRDWDNITSKPDLGFDRENIANYLVITSSVTMMNMMISVILIGLYIDLYRKIKSRFTLALVMVMVAFFLYSFTANPFIPALFDYRFIGGIGPFMIIPHLFTSLALLMLLFMSLEFSEDEEPVEGAPKSRLKEGTAGKKGKRKKKAARED